MRMQAREACLLPTRCIPLGLRYKRSEWDSKLGCVESEMQYVGEKVWGCGLEIFDLVRCYRPYQHVGLGRLNGAYWVYRRCFGL